MSIETMMVCLPAGSEPLAKWLMGMSISHVKVAGRDVAAVFGGRGEEHVDGGDPGGS